MAGQVTQVPDPAVLLNVPASQAAHATPSEAAVYPGRHTQSDSSLLPSDETVFEGHAAQVPAPAVALYVSAMHAAQVPDPTALLYVPGSHALHATPSEGAAYPGRHVQSTNSLLPSDEMVFEGQAAQLPAPAVVLYSPAKHALHATPADVPL